MSGQPAAMFAPFATPNSKMKTMYTTLLSEVHPAGTPCVTITDRGGALWIDSYSFLPESAPWSSFLIDKSTRTKFTAPWIIHGEFIEFIGWHLCVLGLLFNTRHRSTGMVSTDFDITDVVWTGTESIFPPVLVHDFFVFYFELFGLARDNANFRTRLVQLLVGLGNYVVDDRLKINRGTSGDISGRTLIMRYALDRELTYKETLSMLFAMQSSIDPESQEFTGVSGWPLTEVPSPWKRWTRKAANEYLRRLLLGKSDVAPLQTVSEFDSVSKSGGGGAGEGGGGGSKAQDALTINNSLIPFLRGPVKMSSNASTTLNFMNMPSIPSMFAEERVFVLPDNSYVVSVRIGRYILTIGALALGSSSSLFHINARSKQYTQLDLEAALSFTFHPILRTEDGGATVQLLSHPPCLKYEEAATFSLQKLLVGKAGFENAVGVMINACARTVTVLTGLTCSIAATEATASATATLTFAPAKRLYLPDWCSIAATEATATDATTDATATDATATDATTTDATTDATTKAPRRAAQSACTLDLAQRTVTSWFFYGLGASITTAYTEETSEVSWVPHVRSVDGHGHQSVVVAGQPVRAILLPNGQVELMFERKEDYLFRGGRASAVCAVVKEQSDTSMYDFSVSGRDGDIFELHPIVDQASDIEVRLLRSPPTTTGAVSEAMFDGYRHYFGHHKVVGVVVIVRWSVDKSASQRFRVVRTTASAQKTKVTQVTTTEVDRGVCVEILRLCSK